MRNGITGGVLVTIAVVILIIAYGSLYTVQQTQQVLVVQLGNPVRVVTEPGLHVKLPIVETVLTFDKRILDLEASPQELIASDQKRLSVDAFARYRIVDVLKFYQTLGSIEGAKSQLGNLMNSALRRVLGEASFIEVVRDKRDQLMARIREQVDRDADIYGVSVVDVRIRRADLPEANSQAVYQRMQTDRQREAAGYRADGQREAQQIRARADREVTVTVAEAQSKAEQTRGEGDAERNRIFAAAYNRDKDFFAFYRSMQAYEAALQHNDTRMLLKPDSQFFRFFAAPDGKGGSAVEAAPAPPSGSPQTQGSAR
jgi:membrane protease subunit HflC